MTCVVHGCEHDAPMFSPADLCDPHWQLWFDHPEEDEVLAALLVVGWPA